MPVPQPGQPKPEQPKQRKRSRDRSGPENAWRNFEHWRLKREQEGKWDLDRLPRDLQKLLEEFYELKRWMDLNHDKVFDNPSDEMFEGYRQYRLDFFNRLERRLGEIKDPYVREDIEDYIDEMRRWFEDERKQRELNRKNKELDRRQREQEETPPAPPGDPAPPAPAPDDDPSAPPQPGDNEPLPSPGPVPSPPGDDPAPPMGDPPPQEAPDDPDPGQGETPRYPPEFEQRPPEFEEPGAPEPKDDNDGDDPGDQRRPKAPSLNPPTPPSVTPPDAPSVETPPPPQAPEAVPPPMRPGTPEADRFLRDIIAKAVEDFAKELEEFGDKLNPPAGEPPEEGFDNETVKKRARDLVEQGADYAWDLVREAAVNPYLIEWLQAAIRGTHSHSLLEALLTIHVLPHVQAWLGPDIRLHIERSIKGGKARKPGQPIRWTKRGRPGSKRPDVVLTRILEDGVEQVLAVLDLKTGDAKIDKAWAKAVAAALGIAEGDIGKVIEPVRPSPPGSSR
ncbi:hypothetical protein HLA97_18820 [Gordonia araii NBRC 100433]|nr:hypothetical protein [Gordonia araii NBRC 100433]